MESISCIICIFEILILFDFLNAFFEVNERYDQKNKRIFVILFFSTMVYFINLFDNTFVNLIGIPVVYLILGIGIFKGNTYKKIMYCIIAYVILLGTEFLFAVILSLTSNEIVMTSLADDSSVIVVTIIMKLIR